MVLLCKNYIKFIHNWPNGSGERSLNFFDVFSLFLYYLILEIFEHSWMPFTQGCFVPSLVEIVPVGLKKKIFKFCQCIFAILLLSDLWKKAGSFIWIPFTIGCFVTSLVKIDLVALDKKIFQISILEKGRGPSFEQTSIPFTQGYFVLSLIEFGPVVLEKIFFNLFVYFRYLIIISPLKWVGSFIWTSRLRPKFCFQSTI